MNWHLLKEIIIIFLIYLLGESIAYLFNFEYFGGLVGLFILLFSLHMKFIKVDDIRQISSFLLGHMPFFFIPAGVSVMVNYYLIDGFYIEVLFLILVSTLIVMGVSALIVQRLLHKKVQK